MRVLVIGGAGFIGRQLVGRLVAKGHVVIVPTRRYAHARELLVYPTVTVLETDIHDDVALARLMQACDAVINLVGVLHSRPGKPYGPEFDRAHVQLPKRIATACVNLGVRRLIHLSALGADAHAPSGYLRSKAGGEAAIKAAYAQTTASYFTLLRPSVVFGPQDRFMNMFASLARLLPVLPLAGAQARLQPVFVQDVAEAVVNVLANPLTYGQTYDLAGPRVYTLGELVRLATLWSGHPRTVLPMPLAVGRLQALLFECLPGEPLMSRDNLDSLSVDNVSLHPIDPILGSVATALESVAPNYLRPLS